MRIYHGSDTRKDCLPVGTFVSKRFKDASKFGYRRAVQSNSPLVFIHTAQVDRANLKRDPARDASYILNEEVLVSSVQQFPTYDVPFKLSKFSIEENETTSASRTQRTESA